jgi:hypothetical protein
MKYLLLIIFACLLLNCTGKKPSSNVSDEQTVFQIDKVDEQTGLQRMQSSQFSDVIEAGGKKYQLYIERSATDSLPHVKSEMGLFADNRVVLNIKRNDQSNLYNKIFTKRDFASLLTESYLEKSVLEGLVFDHEKTESANGNIVLAASVSFPMTDLYVPFTIIITPSGKMSIERDEEAVDVPLSEQPEDTVSVE